MAPFYPLKAKEKGVSVIYVGFVIGTMALFSIISSYIIGRCLKRMGGRKYIIFVSTVLIICQTCLLGYLEYVDDEDTFLLLSFIAQVLGGFGAGANSTASMAILSSFDKDEREKYIGWVEAAFGCGLLFGPLLGAFLYTFGGYIMPFATFAVIYFVSFPFIIVILNKSHSIWASAQNDTNAAGTEEIQLTVLLKKPRFVFGLLS